MKKSFIAVAVAAALPTFAHAQSSVTLYGILDGSVEYSNGQANLFKSETAAPGNNALIPGAKATARVNSGTQSGSRLGIRGSEDLGNGLRGIFTIEHRVSIDTGAQSSSTSFWNGQAFVGLSSNWGQVTVGRQYTPLFGALAPADFTGYTGYNNWSGFTSEGFGKDATLVGPQGPVRLATLVGPQGPVRLDNSVAYKSPTLGGLTITAAYAAGEQITKDATVNTANGASGDVAGIAATWQMGGLYVAAGYHDFNTKTAGNLSSVAAGAVSYKFTDVGASLGYSQSDFVGGNDVKIILGSAFVNVGPGTLFGNVAYLDPSFAGKRNDSGVQYGLTYSLPLSKRTNVYGAFGVNDVSGLQSTATNNLVDNAMRAAVGVRHMF